MRKSRSSSSFGGMIRVTREETRGPKRIKKQYHDVERGRKMDLGKPPRTNTFSSNDVSKSFPHPHPRPSSSPASAVPPHLNSPRHPRPHRRPPHQNSRFHSHWCYLCCPMSGDGEGTVIHPSASWKPRGTPSLSDLLSPLWNEDDDGSDVLERGC